MSDKPLIFAREASGLTREIGPWSVLFFPLKASLNPWYFLLIAIMPFLFPGANIVLSFVFAGILVIIYGVALALLCVCMPRAGANYVVIARGLHPLFGMMEGWRSIIWNPIANATNSFIAAGFLSTALLATGALTHDPSLTATGQALTSRGALIGIALALVIVGGLIDFFGAGTLKRSMVILSGITIIGTMIMIAIFLLHPAASVPAAWDSVWGNGAYNEIVNVAKANGWKPAAFSWDATIGCVLVARGFLYPDNASPLVGEMSSPTKTIMIGIGFSGVILALFAVGASGSLIYSFGDFISMYNFVINGYASQLKINPGLSPNLSVFAASLTPNLTLSTIILLIPFISMVGLIPHGYFWTTRPMFAMAFDRYMPKTMAYVSPRWHAPTHSWIYCFLMQVVFVVVAAFIPIVLSVSLFILATLLVIWWSESAIALPFQRPRIYERGYKWEVAGFPVMAILGLVSAVLEYVILFAGVATVTTTSIYITVAIMGLGMLGYMVFSQRNSKMGLEPEKIFSEVPPE
ncbi:MAG: APC family permease [Candidatus Bathyarchaeia archaeon]